MKKIVLSAFIIASVMVFALPVSAAAPNWDIKGDWTFSDIWQGVPYVHSMTIDTFDRSTGVFSGHGFYVYGQDLTWIISGIVSGNNVSYLLTVQTPADVKGVTITGTGTIDSDTQMVGSGYQSNLPGVIGTLNINWTATEGVALRLARPENKEVCKKNSWTNFNIPFFKNQGDCVSYVQSNPNAIGNKTK